MAANSWTIADDEATTGYVDRILGIEGGGVADTVGEHTNETLESTVKTLRGYNTTYGYCDENELAHMWYLEQKSGASDETKKKLDVIMNDKRLSREQKLESSYETLKDGLSDEDKKNIEDDKKQIDDKFSRSKTVAKDETVGVGKKKKSHEKIVKKCTKPKSFMACIPKSTTVPYDEENAKAVNDALGTDVDFKFIAEKENGKNNINPASTGYVPWGKGAKSNNSGVTIGTGFDLGAHNESDLKRMGLTENTTLYNKLKPYLGLKKQAACNKLAADMVGDSQLILTDEEIKEIDGAVKKDKVEAFKKNWNALIDVETGVKFEDLDPDQQTALASRAFQQGPAFLTKKGTAFEDFKDAAITGDWETAQTAFEKIRDSSTYKTRMTDEAVLLNTALEASKKKAEEEEEEELKNTPKN